ncbi:MAG: hypothetical protein IJJ82_03140 [Clostridia bacterium]|nr:hypothetical protein [Clostridia bacterium]
MDIKQAIEYAKISLSNMLTCNASIISPDSLEAEMWITYRLYDYEQIHNENIKLKKGERRHG